MVISWVNPRTVLLARLFTLLVYLSDLRLRLAHPRTILAWLYRPH